MFSLPTRSLSRAALTSLWIGPLFFVLLLSHPVQASNELIFTVNSTDDATDANPGDGICESAAAANHCTLRAAIQEANAHLGSDTIHLPAAIYTLTIAGVAENEGAFGDLDITDHLTLNGENAETTVIDGGGLDRVLHVVTEGINVIIEKVTIQNGSTAAFGQNGGGIFNNGNLTIQASIVQNNRIADGTSFYAAGGGIYSYFGVLTLENSLIQDNIGQGIVNFGPGTIIKNSTIQNNQGTGVHSNGVLHLSNSFILSNTVSSRNTIRSLNINRERMSSAGGFVPGGLYIYEGVIENSVIRANTTIDDGGGMSAYTFGQVTVENSTISNNQANRGGGIFTLGYVNFTLKSSSIFSNVATTSGGGINTLGNLVAVNTTLSNNSAGQEGGALFIGQNETTQITLSNVTIAQNLAGNGGGGIHNILGKLILRNSILSGNQSNGSGSDCDSLPVVISDGYNLIQNSSNCPMSGNTASNLINRDPLLGPLQDNGGPTFTHALSAGSPAIDAGNPESCTDGNNPLIVDQRGLGRTADGNQDGNAICDIGAYEANATPPKSVYLPVLLASTSSATLHRTPNQSLSTVQLAQSGSIIGLGLALSIAFVSCLGGLFVQSKEEEDNKTV